MKKALEGVAGVTQVEVSLEDKTATVSLMPGTEEQALVDAVTEAGYKVV